MEYERHLTIDRTWLCDIKEYSGHRVDTGFVEGLGVNDFHDSSDMVQGTVGNII